MKSELLYGRYDTEKRTIDELKTVIWRYFGIIGYKVFEENVSTNPDNIILF